MDKLSAILTAPAPGRGFQAKIAKSWTNNIHEIGPNSANETRKEFSLCLVTFGMVMREQAWAPELRLPEASLALFPPSAILLFCPFYPFSMASLCQKMPMTALRSCQMSDMQHWSVSGRKYDWKKMYYIRSTVQAVAHGARNSEKYE